MKMYRLKFIIILLTITFMSNGQVPNGINYQAMAFDSIGNPLQNQTIRLRFGVVELNSLSAPTFQETHLTTTDANGIFALKIGQGIALINTIDSVNWANTPVFLKVEMDKTGGTNYELIGLTEFFTVPYAFRAAYGADEDADPVNELQDLSLSGDTLSISNGNFVNLSVTGDDLGNHMASQNLQLGASWLSGDGDNEGIQIDADGVVNTTLLKLSTNRFLFADNRGNTGFTIPLDSGTSAVNNTMFGSGTGSQVMTGIQNSLFGHRSGQSLTSGYNNIYLGVHSGRLTTTGYGNVAIGVGAGEKNLVGQYNTFLGDQAGKNSTGAYNTIVGKSAGYSLTTGHNNVLLGTNAGVYNQTGSNNVFLGMNAGFNELGSNRLYVDNSNTASPLVYGEFDNDLLRVNGDLDITGNITQDGMPITINTNDNDSTNELQTLNLVGQSLSISGGNSVALPVVQSDLAVDLGVFDFSPDSLNQEFTIAHGLGEVPKLFEISWYQYLPYTAEGREGHGTYNGVKHKAIVSWTSVNGFRKSDLDSQAIIRLKSDNAQGQILVKWAAKVVEMNNQIIRIKVYSFDSSQTIHGMWKVLK